jgi:hypothetical protein
MSTKVEYTYPRAPITVEPEIGRRLDFEVDAHGRVEITAEVDDSTWAGPRTTDIYFTLSVEDWAAVVKHVQRDLALPGQPQAGDQRA